MGPGCPWRRSVWRQSWAWPRRRGGVEQHRDGVGIEVRDDQIGLAVAVQIADGDENGTRSRGESPVGRHSWAWSLPGAVVLSSTETVLPPAFATTRSGLPSPLRSPTVTEYGIRPVAKVLLGGKAGRGRARRGGVEQHRDGVAAMFATTRSGLPSPFRSPTVTEYGTDPARGESPVWRRSWGWRRPGAVVLSSTETVLERVRDDQIGLAIAVQIGDRDGLGRCPWQSPVWRQSSAWPRPGRWC